MPTALVLPRLGHLHLPHLEKRIVGLKQAIKQLRANKDEQYYKTLP